MVALLIKGEIQFSSRDYSIGTLLIVHIVGYLSQYVQVLLKLLGLEAGILKFTLNFFSAVLYQSAIYYCQVAYLSASFDLITTPTEEETTVNNQALKWMMLEILFYYTTVFLTILFLLFQSLFKIKIPTPKAQGNASINAAEGDQEDNADGDFKKDMASSSVQKSNEFWSEENQN